MSYGGQLGEVYGIRPYLEHGPARDEGEDLDLPTSTLAPDEEHEISFGAIYDTPLKEDVFMDGAGVPLPGNSSDDLSSPCSLGSV